MNTWRVLSSRVSIGLAIIVLILAIALFSWAASSTGEPLTFVAAQKRDITKAIALAGVLNFEETLALGPPVPGARPHRRYVEEGATVNAGSPLIAFELPRAVSDVERRRTSLRRAQVSLQKRKKTDSDDPLDAELAELDVRSAELELLEATKVVSQLLLRAPFDGRVIQVAMTSGAAIGSQPSIVLARGHAPVVEVELDEFDAVQLHAGTRAEISVSSLNETFSGTVLRKPSLRRLRAGGGVFVSVLGFNEPSMRLSAGMTANVSIVTGQALGVVAVPRRALVLVEGRPHVLVRDNQGDRLTRVTLGLVGHDSVEISRGLNAGTLVAVADSSELLNAARLR